jgi:hypothetical protein
MIVSEAEGNGLRIKSLFTGGVIRIPKGFQRGTGRVPC